MRSRHMVPIHLTKCFVTKEQGKLYVSHRGPRVNALIVKKDDHSSKTVTYSKSKYQFIIIELEYMHCCHEQIIKLECMHLPEKYQEDWVAMF